MAAAYALMSLVFGGLAAALLWPMGALAALLGASFAASIGVGAVAILASRASPGVDPVGDASLPLQAHEPI